MNTKTTLVAAFAFIAAAFADAGVARAEVVAAGSCATSLPTNQLVLCLAGQVSSMRSQLDQLQLERDELAEYLSVDTSTDSVIFSGANVYVQNGEGDTWSTNGRGNLIVGYDEQNDNNRYWGGP